MNASIANAWAAALRSGAYKQTTGRLRDDFGFCCLGVLCDLYTDEHPEAKWGGDVIREFRTEPKADRAAWCLPSDVQEWAGMSTDDGYYGDHDEYDEPVSLVTHNDNGETFNEIAEIIEAKVDVL